MTTDVADGGVRPILNLPLPPPFPPPLAEHATFIAGLKSCGRDWKRISLMIPTRTVVQIRTHAQKFFAKLQKVREG
jgi:SHAQKYF class myb-like DNA-binding protein